jgi:hypothetical protein
MRVDADDYLAYRESSLLGLVTVGRGGHRYFEQGKPLLSLSSPFNAAPGPRRPNESHTTSGGSRIESDGPGTWTEPGQGTGPNASQQGAELRTSQQRILLRRSASEPA